MPKLVIVESPHKAEVIEKFLGRSYTVKATMGHIRDLPKSRMGIDIQHGMEPEYINIRGKGDTIKELKNLAKKAEAVYLATDPDREGEAISWHLATILGLAPAAKCRVAFQEITKGAVTSAMKAPRAIDQDMVDAQQARRLLDRLVGYSLSPLLWSKIRSGLSAGRVQSVVVKLIADRDREIAAFLPQEYWTLEVKLREAAKAPIFSAELVKYQGQKLELATGDQAKAAEAALAQATYTVEEAVRKDRRRHALPPFTTSTLQQEANRKLGFPTAKTMLLAQQLYEGVSLGRTNTGLITYMRTDAVRLADSARAEIKDYVIAAYGPAYYPERPNYYAARGSAQEAHEAIRPTSINRRPEDVAPYLGRDQARLYQLIWRRTLASQMAEAVYDATNLGIKAGDYQLRASGSLLKFPGFLAAYGDFADEEKESKVPYIEVGKELLLHKLEPAQQHFTEPPAHYTEAALVKKMEEAGIGRPSTYSPTIMTTIKRGYVERSGKKLLITQLGEMTNDFLTSYFPLLIDIPFSAGLESQLDAIAEHQEDYRTFLQNFYSGFHQRIQEVENSAAFRGQEAEEECPDCRVKFIIKAGRRGKYLSCPQCGKNQPLLEKIGVDCPLCGAPMVVRHSSKTGKAFYGCSAYPACNYVCFDKPTGERCPLCGGLMVAGLNYRRQRQVFCANKACANARPAYRPKSTAPRATAAAIGRTAASRASRAKAGGTTASAKKAATGKTAAAKRSRTAKAGTAGRGGRGTGTPGQD